MGEIKQENDMNELYERCNSGSWSLYLPPGTAQSTPVVAPVGWGDLSLKNLHLALQSPSHESTAGLILECFQMQEDLICEFTCI